MRTFHLAVSVLFCCNSFAQSNSKTESLLKQLSEGVCKCIDSIPGDIRKDALDFRISQCIDDKAGAYQMGSKLMEIDLESGKKNIDISVNINKDSKEYKKYYYDMEAYLMGNCKELKNRIAANDDIKHNSISKNPEALKFYNNGMAETKKGDFKKAIENYKEAVKIDPDFAFAYDNMGICYRRINEFDKAIEAYQNSLRIDPNGLMPLQNIAIAYQYKKEYDKAILSYQKLAEVDSNNPEVFYGMGQTYVTYMNEYEKGLDNLCKAYNLYVKMKSPFRSDAEQMIQIVYTEMKKQGKETRFNEILKQNNISPE